MQTHSGSRTIAKLSPSRACRGKREDGRGDPATQRSEVGDQTPVGSRAVRSPFPTLRSSLFALCALCFFAFSSRAQTNLNVLNFGAVGDAEGLTVSCVSNSSEFSIVSTNWAGTSYTPRIGDLIEVFRAGPQLQFSNDPPYMTVPFYGSHPNNGTIVTNQDIICLITNITQGTNLWCPISAGWTMNAYCVVGTNNAPAFQSAIDEASNIVATTGYTNVTIQIPAGRYLMVSSNVLNPNYVMNNIAETHPVLTISSGGITLLGDSATNTILMGCGAGMEHDLNNTFPYGSGGWFNPMRDTLIYCQGPVANNQYPLVFENLTFDGGLTNGAQPYNYWTLYEGNGEGWDTTHHAIADNAGLFNTPNYLRMNQDKEFTNCVFQHWRGEVLICWTADATNAFNDIANCTFYDGNATADNMYYGQHVHGCVFDQMGKVMEYDQYNADLPTVFENNIWTNIAQGNSYALTIVGATTNAVPPSFTIRNNVFHDEAGINAIQFSPAANVSVISNSFIGGGSGLVFTYAGVQPSDGSAIAVMTNFLVADNAFQCGYSVLDAGYPINNMMVSNNTGFDINISTVYAKNIVLANNSGAQLANAYDIQAGPTALGNLSSGITGGQYMLDETNNNWMMPSPYSPDAGDYNVTNIISYGNGRVHELQVSGAVFYLDDSHPSLVPAGTTLQVFAQTRDKANVTNFYTSFVSPGPPMTITNGAAPVTFYWTGNSWVSGSVVPFTASPSNGVSSLSVQFRGPTNDIAGNPIVSWSWNFGDGVFSTAQSPSHVYTVPGIFNPTLVVIDNAGMSSAGVGPEITVTNPVVSFAAGSAVNVAGAAFQFTSPRADSGGNSIANWTWNFGDGTTGTGQDPVHTYTALGTFYPVLTATNVYGVSSMGSGLAITVTNPVVKFAANLTNVCPNYPIQFTSPSVDSGGNAITGWQWNFGDGTGSTAQNPTHTYAATGVYHPVLSVQDAYGLTPASSGPSSVNVVNPTISFSASPTNGVSRLNVQFQSSAVDSLGVAIAGWHWNFGDGSTGAGQSPAHAYSSIGTFYPVLVVTNSVGDLATNNGSGITVTNPVIQFTATPTNLGPNSVVQFSSPSADSGGNAITSWHWDFGDGTTGTAQNPTHSYASAGSYHPVLSVQNTYGLTPTSSGTATINVANPTISFSFSPSNGVSRLNVQFQSPASDSLGVAIAGWRWNFGDGSTGVGENPLHTYTNIGTFYPVLVVTNSVGTLATNDGPGIIVTNPVIPFTVNRTNSCPNLAVQFSAPATDSGGNPVASWTWNFGDGTQGSGQNPAHSYATNGTYHPVLSALNAYGILATGTGTVINVVNPGISFTVTPTNGMSRLAVQFQSPAADSLGVTVTGWHWDFGDGSTGVGENPAHTYTNLGTFYPVLTATNSVGVLSTNLGDGITVTNPMIAFTVTPGSGDASLTVQFQSPSTDTGGNAIQSWNWNFGDGTTGTGENPTHTYTKAGNYYPVLLATNIYGVPPLCSGSPVSVAAAGTASANIAVSPPPPPLTVTGAGATAILSWPATADNCTVQWTTNMGPGAVWFTVNSPAVEVNGQYVVTNVMVSSQMYFRLKQTTASSSQSSSPPSGSISDLLTWLLQHGGAQ